MTSIILAKPLARLLAVSVAAWTVGFSPELRASSVDVDSDPVVLHAEALVAELDGDTARALSLLKRAAELAPGNSEISFDLARLAAKTQSPGEADQFLARPPTSADERLLRMQLLEGKGDSAAAGAEREAILRDYPDSPVAAALRGDAGTAGSGHDRVGVRLALSGQADSNATVLPDDEALTGRDQRFGMRLVVDGAFLLSLARGGINVDLALALQAGAHLNDRTNLSQLDPGSATLSSRISGQGDLTYFAVELSGSQVFLESFRSQYMQEFRAQADWGVHFSGIRVGVYGSGGLRDFRALNAENISSTVTVTDETTGDSVERIVVVQGPNDRDGPRLTGGARLDWGMGDWSAGVAGGIQAELASGANQREVGPEARLVVGYSPGDFNAQVGFAYQGRTYAASAGNRKDTRLVPSLRLGYDLTSRYTVFGSYALVVNQSLAEFEYTRHLAQVGIAARW